MATESDGMSGAEGSTEPERARPKKAKPESKGPHEMKGRKPAKASPEPKNQSSGASRKASPGRRKPSTSARKGEASNPDKRSDKADDPRSDQQLMDEARGGDTGAYGAIYERHAPSLLDLARGWTRSKHDAPDIVHDTFLSLLSCPADFELRGELPPYLRRVAWNAFMLRLRTDTRRTNREQSYAAMRPPEAMPDSQVQSIDLQDTLELLSPRQREVLVHRLLYRGTAREIAELLGIPEWTVKWLLDEGLRALRKKT